ncbi:hypothetical protein [Streptomyces sp. NPDC006510]|uniref:hypothetical protein n=1 Tax=Streptomyces sp. NPDC006510 TaxID=3155600 RepID=UPI0033A4E6D3
MRIRSILSLAVSAVAAVALATPAQAADDGSYLIRDARTGACLAGEGLLGGHIELCSPDTVWGIRNQGDGLVRIVEPQAEGRCLALSPLRIYPPVVWVDECGNSPDLWSIQGREYEGRVAIALDRGEFGSLATQGSRVVVTHDGGPQWVLERVG